MVAGTVYAAQFTFEHDSGLPEDRVSNTFHFATTQVSGIDFANMRDMLEDFYEVGAAGTTPLAGFLSSVLTGNWSLAVYHLTDLSPRVPVYEDAGTVTIAAAQPLPSEVAACVSWKCDPVSGIPPARLRGRTYVGPLSVTALHASDGRPHADFLASLAANGDALKDAADASVTWDFVVYSSVIAGGSGDGARANKITGGWVDNSFDTQRRRGEGSTLRTIF